MKGVVFMLLLALIVCFLACAQYDDESDFRIAVLDGGKSAVITEYVGNKQIVNIPPRIGGIPITGIGEEYSSWEEVIKDVEEGKYAFARIKKITSVTIPRGVTYIGVGAFADCTSLTSVTIPASVASIRDGAFNNCSSLTSITVDSQNHEYSSTEGVLFNKNRTVLIEYPSGKQERNYTIPSSVTSIGDWAFANSPSLTSLVIPSSVTSIGDGAFANCTSLTSVTIPSSVISIGWAAFVGCDSLASVAIPSSVTSIGADAFVGCTSLRTVTLSRKTAIGGKNTFPSTARITYSD
jgi:hypothetical protein